MQVAGGSRVVPSGNTRWQQVHISKALTDRCVGKGFLLSIGLRYLWRLSTRHPAGLLSAVLSSLCKCTASGRSPPLVISPSSFPMVSPRRSSRAKRVCIRPISVSMPGMVSALGEPSKAFARALVRPASTGKSTFNQVYRKKAEKWKVRNTTVQLSSEKPTGRLCRAAF